MVVESTSVGEGDTEEFGVFGVSKGLGFFFVEK